jgi:DNA polymerase-3 subunit epsilon
MSWHLERMLMGDAESTGVDPHRDRIVTFALIEAGGGAKTLTHEWLINPGIPIPEGATEVHGITTEHAQAHGRQAKSAVKEIGEQVVSATSESGIPFVAFNAPYDLTLLYCELLRHGHDTLAERLLAVKPVVDVLVLERHLDPYRPGKPNGRRPDDACGPHTLVECCRLWGIDLTEADAHGAAADALAAGRLAWRLATQPDRFAEFDSRPVDRINPAQWPLDKLHAWQVETKRAQAESFAAYLLKQGKPDDVSRQWPVQPPPPGWDPKQLPQPAQADPERKAS